MESKDAGAEVYSHVDRYGFIADDDDEGGSKASCDSPSGSSGRAKDSSVAAESADQRRERLLLENSRLEKWRVMLRDWPAFVRRHPTTVKRRVRKGIPEALRGRVWCELLDIAGVKREYQPLTYAGLCAVEEVLCDDDIKRDIDRTFPKHAMFAKHGVNGGQQQLYRVLRAYAGFDAELGYCQGMGFIVAIMLFYMTEEEAFWVLVALMKRPLHEMESMFSIGMAKTSRLLYQFEGLMGKFLPRMMEHLNKEGIAASMYATQWFITGFSYNFPFEVVVRIWDSFMLEGWKVIFRVALTIMSRVQGDVLAGDFESILGVFRLLPGRPEISSGHADKILTDAFKWSLKKSHMEALMMAFEVRC